MYGVCSVAKLKKSMIYHKLITSRPLYFGFFLLACDSFTSSLIDSNASLK
jgi:hypothetical protein